MSSLITSQSQPILISILKVTDDSELEISEDVGAGPSTSNVLLSSDAESESSYDEPMDLSDHELVQTGTGTDDVEDEATAALEIAEDRIDMVSMSERKCHCVCSLFNGQPCIQQFSLAEQDKIRLTVKELTSFEKDLLLLGIISASVNNSDMTLGQKRKQTKRQVTRIRWFFYGSKRICRKSFLYLMEISKEKFHNVKTWYLRNGLVPRKKKSGGRRGKSPLSLDDARTVVRFILNYAAERCILLPGRIPGINSEDVKLLPSDVTKAQLWRLYCSTMPVGHRAVALSTFRKLWGELLPYIVVAKPATDLCWTCQKNNNLIVKQVNVPDEEKTEALRKQEQHLLTAKKERECYSAACKASKAIAEKYAVSALAKSPPNSIPENFHYSFDFAQQVHYPANPHQPGPIYFKTPRKCQIFGVAAEGLPAQVNYLVDEGVSCGKGANVVISYLHHFLENYGIGEQHVQLNADNCCGQNKNNTMLQYMSWRVHNKLHKSVSLAFLMVGHTKFAPDWCFGLFKRTYRRTHVSSLQDIVDVVAASTQKGINIPQLVGNESGEVYVPVYDWASHLSDYYRRFPGIKSYHHYRVLEGSPGVILYKEQVVSTEQAFHLALSAPALTLPPVIQPTGLNAARRRYLFDHIRDFCKDEAKDLVCPAPEG